MTAWMLVFHLLGMAFWVGGLLLVTKLLATHLQEPNPDTRQTLAGVQRALFRHWVHPGAIAMLVTGAVLVYTNPRYYLSASWMHFKLSLVVLLLGLDLWTYFRAKSLAAGRNQFQRRECVALQGGVALVFVAILILVLVKPLEP